jgi:SAM-dependent methyltransferase
MQLDEYRRMADIEDHHWWWRARREIVSSTIERYAPHGNGAPLRVLEVGCGTGGNLPTLAKFGHVLGAEHEQVAIDFLLQKHGARFEVIRHSIPEPLPEKVDILAMLDVLEHIDDDAGALEWVASQLLPGGIAVITVPAFPFLWSDLDDAVHHRRRYVLADFTPLIPPSLELVHLTCYNSILFPLVAGARVSLNLLPRRLRPAGAQLNVPPKPLNWLFYQAFRAEQHFAPRLRAPFGVSILLVLRRPLESA